MMRVLHYYSRFDQARGGFGSLPRWARYILGILAIPGIALIFLSFIMLGISILALLLVTLPAYRLLKAIAPGRGETVERDDMIEATIVSHDEPIAPRRPIEVKILEP